MTHWLTDWPTDWLSDEPTDWVIYQLIDSLPEYGVWQLPTFLQGYLQGKELNYPLADNFTQ